MVRIKYSLLAKLFALVFFVLFILPSLLNLFNSSSSSSHDHREEGDASGQERGLPIDNSDTNLNRKHQQRNQLDETVIILLLI
jgi:hypothetical protein